jgi:hypothetical protein
MVGLDGVEALDGQKESLVLVVAWSDGPTKGVADEHADEEEGRDVRDDFRAAEVLNLLARHRFNNNLKTA